jgi:hypothetical protein
MNESYVWKTQPNFDSHIHMLCNCKHGHLTPRATEKYLFNLLSALHFDSDPTGLLSAKYVAPK